MGFNINSGYGQSLANAVPIGAGKVFHVCQAGSTQEDYLSKALVPDHDGVQRLYAHNATSSVVTYDALNAAVGACVSGRNDYVIVWPSATTYHLTSTIAIGKRNVHLICPAGYGYEYGSTNAARLQMNTAATPVITIGSATAGEADSVEVAGFYIKEFYNGTNASGGHILLQTGSMGPCIHHNSFICKWVNATNVVSLLLEGTAGAYGSITRNWFYTSQASGAYTCAAMIQCAAGCVSLHVDNNLLEVSSGQTCTVGISIGGLTCSVNYNVLVEHAANVSYGVAAGTFGAAISVPTCGAAIGNKIACTTGHGLAGGTANQSFCDNRDGYAGGATPIET